MAVQEEGACGMENTKSRQTDEFLAGDDPPEIWPMPVDQFLKGPYINRADVLLTRKHRDLSSWLIRWATRSAFSHASLVFLVPHREKGFNNTFVIESASKGVDLSNLADYLHNRRMVVGFRRFTGPWFDEDVRSLVRGRMLNSIKSSYSYATAFAIGWSYLNQLAFGVRARMYGARKAIEGRRERNWQPPNSFICSGLVQLGYVDAVSELISTGRLEPRRISEVVIQSDLHQFLPNDWDMFTHAQQFEIMWDFLAGFEEYLEAVTPEDIARSKTFEWTYVVRDRLAHKVHSQKEAEELLSWRPGKR